MNMETEIRRLNHLCRTYDGINKLIVATANRLHSLIPEADPNYDTILNGVKSKGREYQGLNQIKDKLARDIEKQLELWPIWTQWMKGVPGIGAFIGGNLVLFYYYRFLPVCPKCGGELIKDKGFTCSKCGKTLKGEGNLVHRIEMRDFNTISKWWSYMGRGIDPETGKMPKRKKDMKSNWSTKGRTVGYQTGEQFNRQDADHLYKRYLLQRREYRLATHPNISKGYNLSMAKNEAVKLFLSHFWIVAHVLDGKEMARPWVLEHGGHVDFIPPFYMSKELSEQVQIAYDRLRKAA